MLPTCQRTRELFEPPTNKVASRDRLEIHLAKDGNFIFDVYSNRTNERLVNGEYKDVTYRDHCGVALQGIINRLPERKPVSSHEKEFYFDASIVGATDCTVELIDALVPTQNLIFNDEIVARQWQYILQCSRMSDSCAEVIANYKTNKIVPEHSYEFCSDKPLSGYQQLALCVQQRSEGFGFFMEQGTGKTAPAIAAICNGAIALRATGSNRFYTSIIVVPNNIKINWVNEFNQFATRPGRVTILKGTPVNRVSLLCDAFAPDESGEILYSAVICSYQTLWRSLESLSIIDWDLAILDEAHAIKDAKAKQSKGCIDLRDHSKQRLVMTGTPIANSPLDLYNLLEFMDRGGSGFSTEKEFRKFYGTFDRTVDGFEVLTGVQNLPFLQERLARKSFFISKKEALPYLPDKTYDLIEVEMSPEQEAAYKKLSEQLAYEIEAELASDMQRSMMVNNILTKLLRLSQITSGFATWDELQGLDGEILQPKFYEYFSPNGKIEAVLELLREKPSDEKTIIWANWLPDIEYLTAACDQNDIGHCVFRGSTSEDERNIAVTRFNEDRDCSVFIGTAASGGSGLNLLGYPSNAGSAYATDCTHVVYFSQDWSAIKRAQSEGRAHRRGTRRSVRYTTIVVPDSIDTLIHSKVTQKRRSAMDISDLKQVLASIMIGFNGAMLRH